MSASTPKRVSFGSGQDSIVETLIIDESTIMPVDDPSFDHNLSNHTLPPAILEVKQEFMESQENPFTADGELSKKAEFILRHSTISRTEVRINDPDAETAEPEQIEMIEAQSSSPTQAAPPSDSNGVNSDQTKLKENGKPDSTTTSEPATVNATEPPKDAKPKTKKCKCCVIQ